MDIRPGDTIYGKDATEKFTVVEFIGSGAFGFVYKVKKEGAEEFFALKTVPTGYLDETELRSLVNEGRLAPGIKHENVVDALFFHDGSQYPGLPPYIIMEYLPDGTLQQFLDARRKSSKFFDND
jgi:serine/threonine protein kinase